MQLDNREMRIVLQNSMAHATKIAMHNAKDKKVTVEEILKMAAEIAYKVFYGKPVFEYIEKNSQTPKE